ncbi:Sec8 exocyst complex component-specific domain-containing protein [Syncephalis pseudoplumigaleata]|uniref:Exocyst complex component Sec8 n=1 Tax=Syncephalis pseudoplumigaleata TaxID=1712513 RepID=A0A4P9YU24_9FUNG|nr:Sec8 exocyst complex component-specific domain-containing protein [Syncephalis pseudoplumigaleata]|eukprot:RKP23248.1 Sec8 exocyst complex component-specific domain-containing protein [Syncephalis pseudoplumigaleata]
MDRLEQVVNTVVRTHHRSFTDTIDAYSSVLEAVTAAQKEASELKADMIECKERLRLKRGDLLQWWTRSQQHREMIRLLDEIEDLKKVPERIEQLRQKEEHTAAVAQVVKAMERLEHGSLAGIGALADLKKQLLAEHNTMHERLIEELLKLLYLKNTNASNDEIQDDLGQLSVNWQDDTQDGATRGPLAKLAVLLSCLNELRKLPEALETVRQRMPAEVHQLIDRAIAKLEHEGDGPVELLRILQAQLLRVIEIHRQIYIKAAEFHMRITATFPSLRLDDDENDGSAEGRKPTITNDASIALAAGLLSGEQALGRHVLLAKPGPAVVAKLFRPVLELLERARRIDRIIDVRDILAFMQDFYTTFFFSAADLALQDDMGGINGLTEMVKEIMGEALLEPVTTSLEEL